MKTTLTPIGALLVADRKKHPNPDTGLPESRAAQARRIKCREGRLRFLEDGSYSIPKTKVAAFAKAMRLPLGIVALAIQKQTATCEKERARAREDGKQRKPKARKPAKRKTAKAKR